MAVSRHQNAGKNHNVDIANKLYENVAKFNAWEQHTSINRIQEIIKNKQIWGMPATIRSTIFCLPVSLVKDSNKEKQKFAVVLHGFLKFVSYVKEGRQTQDVLQEGDEEENWA